VKERDDEAEANQPDWVLSECRPRAMAVGIAPEPEHFVHRPYGNAGAERADHVVDVLALEHEDAARTFGRPLRIVFEARPLPPANIEAQLQRAVDQQYRRHVAHEQIDNPADGQRPHRFNAGREPKPVDRAQRHEHDVPRQEIARQPLEEIEGLRRPDE